MKILMLISLFATAEERPRDVVDLSLDVTAYLRSNADHMDQRELRQTARLLRRILNGDTGRPGSRKLRLVCSREHNLINVQNGETITRYRYSHKCAKGKEQLEKHRALCTREHHLYSFKAGTVITRFRYSHKCEKQLESLDKYNMLCTRDHTLMNRKGESITRYRCALSAHYCAYSMAMKVFFSLLLLISASAEAQPFFRVDPLVNAVMNDLRQVTGGQTKAKIQILAPRLGRGSSRMTDYVYVCRGGAHEQLEIELISENQGRFF